jgi:transcriptional regulator with XRE-family HTH domain/tetratricopeptide (TPR) repeat protein
MPHSSQGEERAERKGDPDKRLAFVLFRYLMYWDQADLSREAGISQSQISLYVQGHRTVPDAALERTARAAGFPVFLLPLLLKAIRAFRSVAKGRWKLGRILSGDLATGLLGLGQSMVDLVAAPGLPQESAPRSPEEEREAARVLWDRLRHRPADYRITLVEEDEEYRTWALCEQVAAASIEAAGADPQEAVRLAQLAVWIAELCPGPKAWRWRLEGYAGFHLANAHRASGTMPEAREARAWAKKLWEAGATADPGLLNEALVLQIEANLLLYDRQFAEALKFVEKALQLGRSSIAASLLYTKARILEDMDDIQGSTSALEEAAALVDALRETRLALAIRLQLLLNLCLEDRAVEAQHRLGEVRAIAERLNRELDLTRVLWVEGLAAAGVGQSAEAEAKLNQVRVVMAEREIAFDYALATLDLAVVLLAENRTTEVRAFATDLLWIFRSQQMNENALAAVRLFAAAARQESVTVGLARRIRRFLGRAQNDPELKLEEAGAGE